MRVIPNAVIIEVDDSFGNGQDDKRRRFALAFRAVNSWDLDRLRAKRENVHVGGLLISEIISALTATF